MSVFLRQMMAPPVTREAADARAKQNEPLAALQRLSNPNTERGTEWAKPVYGDYYATSVPVYRAVRLRANAVARARMKVWMRLQDGSLEWVGEDHPVQQALDRVNPWWSHVDLWRGVETYLSLWGSAFRWINRGASSDPSRWETWLLRPDKVAVVRDQQKYVKGFIYDPYGARFAMLPDEVLWDRYFNPLDEYAGLSPIAPLRLSADMRADMIRANREHFRQGISPQNIAFFLKQVTDEYTIQEFQERLQERYSGAANANKPFVLAADMADVKNLGLSNREMEWIQGMTVARNEILTALEIPDELMPGSEHTTFANREEARREFYENTVEQEWSLLESGMQERFAPMLPEQYRDLIFAFDRSNIAALADNLTEVSERKRQELAAGGIMLNEFRRAIGEDEIPNGDVFYLPIGVMPVPADGEMAAPPPDAGDGERRMLPPVRKAEGPADEAVWKAFVERTDRDAEDFAEMQNGLFEEQRTAVLRAIRARYRGARGSRIAPAAKAATASGMTVEKDDANGFDEPAWLERFALVGRDVFERVLGRNAEAQAAEFSLGIAFDVSRPVVQAWVDERTRFWAETVNAETAKMLTEEIQAGIAEGEGIRKLEERVGRVFDFNVGFRTERIARTETTSAANQGHIEAYRQAGIQKKRWLATMDSRVRDAHAAANGQVRGVDEAFTVGGETIMAPGQGSAANAVNCRCLPADIRVVANGLNRVYRRWYEGDLVRIRTALGHELSGTPNHPVLTPLGWVQLASLRKGDYVVSSTATEWMAERDPDVDNVPSTIGKIFDSAKLTGLMQRVRTSPVDFHGDGRQQEVDVVTTDDGLAYGRVTALDQKVGEFSLALSHGQMGVPGRNRSLGIIVETDAVGITAGTSHNVGGSEPCRDDLAACAERTSNAQLGFAGDVALDNLLGVDAICSALGFSYVNPAQPVALGKGPEQALLDQRFAQSLVGDVEPPSENLDTLPRNVAIDRVVEIVVTRFAGHVYNLETPEHWYIAEGIVTHNCTTVPVMEERSARVVVRDPKREVIDEEILERDARGMKLRTRWTKSEG